MCLHAHVCVYAKKPKLTTCADTLCTYAYVLCTKMLCSRKTSGNSKVVLSVARRRMCSITASTGIACRIGPPTQWRGRVTRSSHCEGINPTVEDSDVVVAGNGGHQLRPAKPPPVHLANDVAVVRPLLAQQAPRLWNATRPRLIVPELDVLRQAMIMCGTQQSQI